MEKYGDENYNNHELSKITKLEKYGNEYYNNLEKFKNNLLDQAMALGFFDAQISEHQIRINLAKNQADIFLTLETGPRYHFGNTTFNQSGYLFEQKFLERYLPYVLGQPYQMGLVNTLQSHLIRLPVS